METLMSLKLQGIYFQPKILYPTKSGLENSTSHTFALSVKRKQRRRKTWDPVNKRYNYRRSNKISRNMVEGDPRTRAITASLESNQSILESFRQRGITFLWKGKERRK